MSRGTRDELMAAIGIAIFAVLLYLALVHC